MLECVENCGPRHPPKRVPWARCQKFFKFTLYIYIFLRNQTKKIYNRAKELYCDATWFVFWFFIVYLPKKNGNWKMTQLNHWIHLVCYLNKGIFQWRNSGFICKRWHYYRFFLLSRIVCSVSVSNTSFYFPQHFSGKRDFISRKTLYSRHFKITKPTLYVSASMDGALEVESNSVSLVRYKLLPPQFRVTHTNI